MKLSVIIPSYKDPLLTKTIDSLLANSELGADLEIVAVLDGYWPSFEIRGNPRVRYVHFGESRGMRGGINAGVAISRGKYILKCDSHCMFGKGFDRLLLEEIKDNWVVAPRLYKLDTEKWEVMKDRPMDYQKFIYHQPRNKIAAQEWISRTRERKNILIDENIVFQGSCWLMSRKHWDNAIKMLEDENYGTFAQEPTEIVMKTFVAGGKTMVNKKTWYAHKHRKFGRTYRFFNKEIRKGNDYVLNHLRNDLDKINQRFGLFGLLNNV